MVGGGGLDGLAPTQSPAKRLRKKDGNNKCALIERGGVTF